MFAKMVLPRLGGAPAVWNTCLVFYQAALLAGYAYAHMAPKILGVRRQSLVHLGILILIFLTLPIALPPGWHPPITSNPNSWLLLVLLVSVGLPFFIISTTAPLLQKWFSHTSHAAARDPYFLYGASNLGSMVALLGYPLLVEPFFPLANQTKLWAYGYSILIGLITICTILLWRSPTGLMAVAEERSSASSVDQPVDDSEPPTFSRRLWWVLLAFAPSSLLLGVTTYLSTDIAAVPLLWIIPLAIYLLTFVLVFARRPIFPHHVMVVFEASLLVFLAILFFLKLRGSWSLLSLHLVAFFLIAMVCHGELMKFRPGPDYLTEFYLWLSVGGVLGGLFNALAAPWLFNSLIEYPLVIVVASLLRPYLAPRVDKPLSRWLDFILPLTLALTLGVITSALWNGPGKLPASKLFVVSCLAGAICFSFLKRPTRFGLGIGAIILAGMMVTGGKEQVIFKKRNFFGILQVTQNEKYRLLYHGTTLHGEQSLDPSRPREPLTYYSQTGPLGQVFAAFSQEEAHWRIAIIGLGTGTIACYGKPGQHLTFFEIDPLVEHIARDCHYFTFLQDSLAKFDVVLGDARLSLQQAPDSRYDIIILDAFNSDAIPVHLVTREALRLYLAKLKEDGILAFHISNNYLDLKPVLGNLAQDAGLIGLAQEDLHLTEQEQEAGKFSSVWVVMARRWDFLSNLAANPQWQKLSRRPGESLWTDDFTNIISIFKWGNFKPQSSFRSPGDLTNINSLSSNNNGNQQ
jgi:SAM-dependent methyltransferase